MNASARSPRVRVYHDMAETTLGIEFGRVRLEQVDGDAGLARSGGQGEKGALRRARRLAGGDFLHDGTDSGILVIAPRSLAARIQLQKL